VKKGYIHVPHDTQERYGEKIKERKNQKIFFDD